MNIILHQPEIPQNTANIGRTCVATGTKLHLIEPLGFRLDDKSVKRAGMDYWQHVELYRYTNFQEFLEKNPNANVLVNQVGPILGNNTGPGALAIIFMGDNRYS